jgi:hypothetical protein
MADHGIAGQMDAKTAEADAPLGMRIEGDGGQVGNEIHHAVFLLAGPHLAAEKIFLAGKTILEFVGNVENELGRVEDVHHQRQVVRCGEAHRLAG